jgi:hypothetical protein
MRVITRDQVKAQLGITDSSLDASIDLKLPIIDAKVKQISNNRFNFQVNATLTSGSDIATISSLSLPTSTWKYTLDDIEEYLMVGDQIEGDGIPAESYISELYYNGSYVTLDGTQYTIPAIKLSVNATESGIKELFLGINIGYHDIIAKGVQYLITGTSQSLPQNRLKSKSLPPLSVTYADSTVNKTYGMPNWFVEALPTYMSGH